jgi:Tol biopolymer transport system component
MEPDGSNPQFLVAVPDMGWNGSPAWAHDGKMVAFDANRGGYTLAHLYVFAARGPFKGTLKDMGVGNTPCWSPDDSQMACFVYGGNRENVRGGIWIINVEDGTRRWLCEGERMDWSPDGTKLLVESVTRPFGALEIVNVDSGQRKRVVENTYEKIPGGSWSPDGKKIAFIGFREYSTHQSELVVMDADGAAESQKILLRGRLAWQPHWSPDGAKLTFTMWQPSGVEHSYTINVVGDHTPQKFENQEPGIKTVEAQWSGDGKRIVFSRDK